MQTSKRERPERRRRLIAFAAGVLLTTGLAACGSGDGGDEPSGELAPASPSPAGEEAPSASPTEVAAAQPSDARPFGPECGILARRQADLGEILPRVPLKMFVMDGYPLVFHAGVLARTDLLRKRGLTFLFPVTQAYRILPTETHIKLFRQDYLEVLAPRHVLEGRVPPSELVGEHRTLAGTTLSIANSDDGPVIGLQRAGVLCGNIRLAGATVYLIDAVLLA